MDAKISKHHLKGYNIVKRKNNRGSSSPCFHKVRYLGLLNYKKGQVTIFIIIALMIVVLIAMIFVSRIPPKVDISDDKTPHSFIESCTKQAVQEALKKIQETGGDIGPKLSVRYENINRSYLCYTTRFYQPCVNQRPGLIEHIETQITEYIKPKLLTCFDSLESDLSKRYQIEMGDMEVKTKLAPKEVLIEINRKFKMSRGDTKTMEFENFKIQLLHPIYDLAKVSNEIVNQEARFCSFNALGYMTVYPQFDITRFKTGDADIIYKVKDRSSAQDFNFAIRSCPLPPGF